LTIELPEDVFIYAVEKGSITIDGVSLTIAGVGSERTITITIVPYTLQETIVSEYKAGTPVNVEVDIVAKYVRHYLMNSRAGDGQMSG
jgi:riboflavin synthase